MAQNRKKPIEKTAADRDGNAILITFALAVVVFCLLIFVYRLYNSSAVTLLATYNALVVIRWVALGMAVIFAVWTALVWRKKGRTLAAVLTAAALVVSFSCFMMSAYYLTGVKLLCGLYAVAAVLYLIYLIYKWEFFTVCSLVAVSGMALWLMMIYSGRAVGYAAFAVGALCCILWAVFLALNKRGEGKVKLFKKQFSPYKSDANYPVMFAVIPCCAAALIVGLVSAALCYYCMIALVCIAFICAVYYTVKLM